MKQIEKQTKASKFLPGARAKGLFYYFFSTFIIFSI